MPIPIDFLLTHEEAFPPAALQGKGMIGASLCTIGKNRTHSLKKE